MRALVEGVVVIDVCSEKQVDCIVAAVLKPYREHSEALSAMVYVAVARRPCARPKLDGGLCWKSEGGTIV